ncbi:uncharacterized protein LOC123528956 isoform X2 [Mercenaria mercenaria]|uniref:uncharacterized protein LOC123528956 isoform X2 n=1 Tax=Mercenaria mercenaria TaxID=6596 RepID=UPI001E1D9E8F|nr:uncharacterized protein LOC123528956 isoform X2 [Mercenaria mercenaria]
MFIRIFGIFVLVLCGGNLSAVLNRKHVSNETSKCFNRNKFMKLQKAQIPRVETAVNIAQDVNITASFHVELKEDNVITGSIKWIFNKDEDMTNLIVRLSFVNNQVETTDYFLIHVDSRSIEHNGSRYANMNCIKVPPTTNTTIIAELHRINLTSCGCDITDLNITYCLHLCHMYHVSTHTFLSSRDACYCYRERNQDELRMNLKAEMISTNFTRFRGYFSNVNPYLIARVSIFPEDIDHSPHVPILTLPVKVNAEREIYFSGVSQSLGFSEFYAMLTVSCSEGEIPDHFSSHTARARPYEEEHNSQHSEKFDSGLGGNIEKNTDDSVKIDVVVYGMVTGLIGVCCIVTVIVWLKCFRGKKRRTENIRRSCDAGRDLQVEPYTPSKWYSDK